MKSQEFNNLIPENPIQTWLKSELTLKPWGNYTQSEQYHRLRAGIYAIFLAFGGYSYTLSAEKLSQVQVSQASLEKLLLTNSAFSSACFKDIICAPHEIFEISRELSNPRVAEQIFLGQLNQDISMLSTSDALNGLYSKQKMEFDSIVDGVDLTINPFDSVGLVAQAVSRSIEYDENQLANFAGIQTLPTLQRMELENKTICTGTMYLAYSILRSANINISAVQYQTPNDKTGHALIGLHGSFSEIRSWVRTSKVLQTNKTTSLQFLDQYKAIPFRGEYIIVFDPTANGERGIDFTTRSMQGILQESLINPSILNHSNDLGSALEMTEEGTVTRLVSRTGEVSEELSFENFGTPITLSKFY